MKAIILYPLNITILFFTGLGNYFTLIKKIFRSYKNWGYYLPLANSHMFNIGVKSIPIVIITGLFSGMVLAVQASYQIQSASSIPMLDEETKNAAGSVVGEAILLELAPMITALVMTGKIGATIAAEIGTMKVSEQIDALESLSYDPVAYLIFPRIVAGMIMFPILIAVADIFGLIGGILVATDSLGIKYSHFMEGLRLDFGPMDYWFGIIK